MSKRKSATIFDFFGGAKRSKDGDDGEACEWWRNLWTVLPYWQAESVKYDTCFQKSSYLPWRLKFGHLGASGYQIYFSVYRVGWFPPLGGLSPNLVILTHPHRNGPPSSVLTPHRAHPGGYLDTYQNVLQEWRQQSRARQLSSWNKTSFKKNSGSQVKLVRERKM